jgi:hypothetical protein
MEIHVSPNGPARLLRPDDLQAFKVVLDPALDGARRALEAAGAARVQEHAWIPVARLRELAGDAATPEWERGLQGMVGFARSHGFYDEELGAVRAHCEFG